MLLPYIVQPTTMTYHSKTLIDTIFSNIISKEVIFVILTCTRSDHFHQFLIMPSIFPNQPVRKTNKLERNWNTLSKEVFIITCFFFIRTIFIRK